MLLKERIKKIIELQNKELQQKPLGVSRELLRKIDLETPHGIIISGIRRCGKSTVLRQLMKKVKNPYYCNFEDPRISGFTLEDFEGPTLPTNGGDGTLPDPDGYPQMYNAAPHYGAASLDLTDAVSGNQCASRDQETVAVVKRCFGKSGGERRSSGRRDGRHRRVGLAWQSGQRRSRGRRCRRRRRSSRRDL